MSNKRAPCASPQFPCPKCNTLLDKDCTRCPMCGEEITTAPQRLYTCPDCGITTDQMRCPKCNQPILLTIAMRARGLR